jgi:hypothetical protein
MMKFKDEFERVHREIIELQRSVMDQAGKDRQQTSAISYEISRQYGDISRRLQSLETKVQQILTNIGLKK